MTTAARRWSWLTAFAVVAGALATNPAARADNWDDYAPGPRTVVVADGRFKDDTTRVLVNEAVTFVLQDDAEHKHTVTFGNPPNPAAATHYELDPSDPNQRAVTVTFAGPGYHTYRCTLHPHRGVVKVRTPLTATTAVPAPTTTTARPTSTTTTTRTKSPVATTPPPTAPGGVVSAASKATTTTTRTLLAIPAQTAPSSGAASSAPADRTADVEGADPSAEEIAFDAASHQQDGDETSNSTVVLIIAIALAAAVLGAGGWGWYHRSSRYLPA
jgi:plastocyanin